MMEKITTGLLAISVVISILVLISFLFSYPVFLLWNGCFVGAITGVQEITWLQAWGISVLFGLLFKPTTARTEA